MCVFTQMMDERMLDQVRRGGAAAAAAAAAAGGGSGGGGDGGSAAARQPAPAPLPCNWGYHWNSVVCEGARYLPWLTAKVGGMAA